VLDSAGHHALAHEAAVKSFVLLKRVAAPTPAAGGMRSVGSATAEMMAAVTVHLPLSDATPATIAVIGPAADNRAALINRYTGSPTNVTTMLGGIRARAAAAPANITVGYASGSDVSAAVALAARSTVAVVVLTANPEGESRDRDELGLPSDQAALLRALLTRSHSDATSVTPIVLVMVSGGPVDVGLDAETNPNVIAVIQAGQGGEEAGSALASLLFGDVDFSGRLASTVCVHHPPPPPVLCRLYVDIVFVYHNITHLFAADFMLVVVEC
jgi:beta-glucosidase